jgi:antagonist of KipI
MIEVVASPPYVTVQDLGRTGYRAQGVPVGGAMDPWALSIANVLVGNAATAAALEWGLGGGTIRCHRAGACALAGAAVEATLGGAPMAMHRTYHASAGDVLRIHRLVSGRFTYVAFAGGIDVPIILGSRSTYLPGCFGGLAGRLLRSGDRIELAAPTGAPPAANFSVPSDLQPRYAVPDCRILPGPHASLCGPRGWTQLTSAPFRVDVAGDRTGYRLDGPVFEYAADVALPSAPICVGAVQIPVGGRPIVLMADAPTVGGYPVIAVVGSADVPVMAQRRPGEEIWLRQSSVGDLQRALRSRAVAIHTLAHIARASATAVT